MRSRKLHVAVFFGGTSDNHDLSTETGYWVCQYLPRAQYRVTPVHVTHEGLWQVPLGNLPQSGSVDRMMDMMFQAVPAQPVAAAIERLLRQPVHALMTVIRGAGGDDGALHSLGQTLSIPVVGSGVQTCQQTSDKQSCARRLEDLVSVPLTYRFPHSVPPDDVIETVRTYFVPPVFVKPAAEEGSVGVEAVQHPDELPASINRVRTFGDVLVQERLSGTEMSVSVFKDDQGRIHVLPPTVIVPRKAQFYDSLSKRTEGRVTLHTPQSSEDHLLAEIYRIAEDVYRELNCRGLVSIDCIVADDTTNVLEVNTIPTLTNLTPLKQQLKVVGMHPNVLLDQLIQGSLAEA